MGSIGIDEATVLIQVYGPDVQGFEFLPVGNGGARLFSTDLKNQLAAKVAGFAYPVRGHGFAELIACYFQGTDGP